MADEEFNFEAEFALLDVGATTSMLRSGSVRPTVLAFTAASGIESVALDWTEETGGAPHAFEEARRFLRDLQPLAYAFIAHLARFGRSVTHLLPGMAPGTPNEFLALAMFDREGGARGVSYPVRRMGGSLSYGMPTVTNAEMTDWCPLGDVWGNPFCAGDTVRFLPRERAVDPSTPLWQAVVELTRLRIHEDQTSADEYMAFLDDLRNGVFVVAGRPANAADRVLLRPRTVYNPLGTLNVEAERLTLSEPAPTRVEKVTAG